MQKEWNISKTKGTLCIHYKECKSPCVTCLNLGGLEIGCGINCNNRTDDGCESVRTKCREYIPAKLKPKEIIKKITNV